MPRFPISGTGEGDFYRMDLQKLRALRQENGLTQLEVARFLGTSQTMYARYERGANELPIHHLVKLCRLYNVSADYFLGTEPDPSRIIGMTSA